MSSADRAALAAAGIAAPPIVDATTTPFPYLRCVAQALQGEETELACNGVVRRSRSQQSQAGVSVQAARTMSLGSTTHQLVDSSGRFIAQPFPADGQGRFPLRNSTFYAPGAPRLFSLGLRYAFD